MARARMLPPPKRRRAADFSLAIVNIVLLLVFFFLITGSLVQNGETTVDLAHTSDLPLERLPRPLLLVDRDGNLALDGVPLPVEDLAGALSVEAAPALYVLADHALTADALLRLVQRPDLAGLPVRLVTLHVRRVGLP
jgi:biopolymer transport protein ExbD